MSNCTTVCQTAQAAQQQLTSNKLKTATALTAQSSGTFHKIYTLIIQTKGVSSNNMSLTSKNNKLHSLLFPYHLIYGLHRVN